MTASMDSGDGDFGDTNDNKISNISFNNDGTYSTSGDAVLALRFSGQDETSIVFTLGSSEQSNGLTQNGGVATPPSPTRMDIPTARLIPLVWDQMAR